MNSIKDGGVAKMMVIGGKKLGKSWWKDGKVGGR